MAGEPSVLEFSNGEEVRILRGPFNQFTGLVRKVDMENRLLKVEVTTLGVSTQVEAFFLDVQKLGL
jgi:transcriptional antiterminator NusG